jgi:lipoyl(octanoyl) transferase
VNQNKTFFSESSNKVLQVYDLNRIEYKKAYELQKSLQKARMDEEIPDTLLVLEHDPVFTLGKRGKQEDILASPASLEKYNIQTIVSDRGGQVTYHGPGQLVVYCIFNLYQQARELRKFVKTLEQAVINLLKDLFNISAEANERDLGVWIDNRKIAALGITVNRHVTRHGLALNIDPNMNHFNLIVPCGIHDKQVTSVVNELLTKNTGGDDHITADPQVVDFLRLSTNEQIQFIKSELVKYLAREFGFSSVSWKSDSLSTVS